MNSRIKPVSRLSVVFILAVVISGSILTYFSINNISNLKELTEKRILEEQSEFANRFSTGLKEKIDNVTRGFKKDISIAGILQDSLIKTTNTHDFIRLSFILKNNGSFLYPNFIGIPDTAPSLNHSTRYLSTFSKGEKAEFADKNLLSAKKQYLKCLDYAIGSIDSVRTLNALGRVSVKQNNREEAFSYYNVICLKYFQVVGGDGIPYLNYVIPQILKIAETKNIEKILPVVTFCLDKMANGAVPLNYATEEMLNLITEWLQVNTLISLEKVTHIDSLKTIITQQLSFLNKYGNDLSDLVTNKDRNNYLPIGNDFLIANTYSEKKLELLLINPNLDNPTGFLLDRKNLFDAVLKNGLQSGFEFEYKMEFTSAYEEKSNGQNLTYSSQLNPFFPSQLMHVKLNDESLIRDFILRRSWIYAIALILLLVAMILGVALILRDIAREKHVAHLRSNFISNVTHELKTPLTSIYMFTETLLLGRVKSVTGKKEYLSIILRESERLKRMINNILEFSKMEKGKSEYHFVNSNVASVIRAALHDMSYWFKKGQFDIVTDLDENIEAEIDPEKINQAIANLLSNAYKYSIKTKKIVIRLLKKVDEIIIEVEDEGLGIPADHLTKIFEKFYRINQSESISGTGLGLTVVKEIVEAHHGEIFVTSKIGEGSKFTIILNQQMKEK